MNDGPSHPEGGAQAGVGRDAEERSDQTLGVWRVTDTTDRRIPKKSVVEFVLEPDAFAIRLPDATTYRVPYEVARYRKLDDPKRAAVDTQGGLIWVEAQGSVMPPELERGLSLRRPPPPLEAELLPWGKGEPPPVLTRQYTGQKTVAAAAMGKDAAVLQRYGYAPTSQTFAEGTWGCGAWVLAFLALFLLVGIVILVYMAVNRPDGTLTVIYERRIPAGGRVQVVPTEVTTDRLSPTSTSSARDRLLELDELRAEGMVTDDEYTAKRAAILESL